MSPWASTSPRLPRKELHVGFIITSASPASAKTTARPAPTNAPLRGLVPFDASTGTDRTQTAHEGAQENDDEDHDRAGYPLIAAPRGHRGGNYRLRRADAYSVASRSPGDPSRGAGKPRGGARQYAVPSRPRGGHPELHLYARAQRLCVDVLRAAGNIVRR